MRDDERRRSHPDYEPEYKKAAKEEGAEARCGWKGINRYTVIQPENEKVKRAADLSKELFAGKKDLSGVEYYKHLEKVASLVYSDAEKIVAYLHDVLEDTDYPEEKIREEFDDSVADAVLLLTHKERLDKEGYLDYIRKLKGTGNQVAIHVKIADLTHNSDISRLGASTVEDLTQKQKERYLKYQEALEILKTEE